MTTIERKREINAVLAAIATQLNRPVPDDLRDRDRMVGEWAAAIPDRYSLDELMQAVSYHRATSSEWLEPRHLVAIVRGWRQDRLLRAGPVPFPDGLTQAQERTFREAWQSAICRGADRETAHQVACGQVGVRAELEHRGVPRPKELAN